jgi:hypothetical protein
MTVFSDFPTLFSYSDFPFLFRAKHRQCTFPQKPIAPCRSQFLLTNLYSLDIRARISEVLRVTQKLRSTSHQRRSFVLAEKLTFYLGNSRHNLVPHISREVGGPSMGLERRLRSSHRGCWVSEVNAERGGKDLRAIRAVGSAVWFLTYSTGSCFGSHKCSEETCCEKACELHGS